MLKLHKLFLMRTYSFTTKEIATALLIAIGIFIFFGTVTALWSNPFFIRMVPVRGYEYILLTAESFLIGAYLGIQRTYTSGTCSTTGGVLAFLGIACPVCNKLLLLLFGSTFLLSYFEPIRLYVGLLGIFLLSWALYKKITQRII